MTASAYQQFLEFSTLFAIGMIFGLIFISTQKLLLKLKSDRSLIALVEIVFGFAYVAVSWGAVYILAKGEIAFYHILALLFGSAISSPIFKLVPKLIHTVKKNIRKK